MDMRDLTDEERVLLAELRMCEEPEKEKICSAVHRKANAEKPMADSASVRKS